jgi:hypothetical protein
LHVTTFRAESANARSKDHFSGSLSIASPPRLGAQIVVKPDDHPIEGRRSNNRNKRLKASSLSALRKFRNSRCRSSPNSTRSAQVSASQTDATKAIAWMSRRSCRCAGPASPGNDGIGSSSHEPTVESRSRHSATPVSQARWGLACAGFATGVDDVRQLADAVAMAFRLSPLRACYSVRSVLLKPKTSPTGGERLQHAREGQQCQQGAPPARSATGCQAIVRLGQVLGSHFGATLSCSLFGSHVMSRVVKVVRGEISNFVAKTQGALI